MRGETIIIDTSLGRSRACISVVLGKRELLFRFARELRRRASERGREVGINISRIHMKELDHRGKSKVLSAFAELVEEYRQLRFVSISILGGCELESALRGIIRRLIVKRGIQQICADLQIQQVLQGMRCLLPEGFLHEEDLIGVADVLAWLNANREAPLAKIFWRRISERVFEEIYPCRPS